MTPPPPPKRRPVWPWVVAGVVLLMLGGVGTCVATVTLSITAPTDAANAFADDVIAGDLRGAFERSCPTVKEELGYENFSRSIGSLKVSAVDLTSSHVTHGGGATLAAVEGTMTADDKEVPLRVELVEVDDRWQVCGFFRPDRLPSEPPS